MLVITNGSAYISQKENTIGATSNLSCALLFSVRQKAENFYKNLSTKFKNIGYEIKELDFDADGKAEDCIIDYYDETCMSTASENIKMVEKFFKTLTANKIAAEEELVLVDREIMDIEHAAEFYTLNASQGYKLYKMLHDARCKRRKCKDQISISTYVLDSTVNEIASGTITRRIDGLERRKYNPRILDELFTSERNDI